MQKVLVGRLKDLEMFSAGVAHHLMRRQEKITRSRQYLLFGKTVLIIFAPHAVIIQFVLAPYCVYIYVRTSYATCSMCVCIQVQYAAKKSVRK